jgi:hypothetical protein
MRNLRAALAALAALALLPLSASAQITAGIRIGLPALPSLVVVQPGVQVVQDFDDEVFVHGGVYWARRGDHWYRARGPQAEFVVVETRLVPEPVRRLPPGHYRRYRPPPPPIRRAVVEERKLDKKEEKRLRKEEDRERKDHDRGHDHDRDHHDGHGR